MVLAEEKLSQVSLNKNHSQWLFQKVDFSTS